MAGAEGADGDNRGPDIRSAYERVRPVYVDYADALRLLVQQLCKSAQIPTDATTARAKETVSVVDKIQRRGYQSLDDVVDKCGVRVITRYARDVASVTKLLSREFDVIEVTEHGAEAPDAFGYASKHLVVRLGNSRSALLEWREFAGLIAEIQIRSILQHAWASISHSLDYKSGLAVPDPVRRRLFRVAALLETGDEIFDTYRAEVELLRAEYQVEATSSSWADLPLNLDSLLASWDRFPWQELADVASDAGWRRTTTWDYSDVDDMRLRRSADHLVEIARRRGLKTVGELHAAADAAREKTSFLAEVVRKMREGNKEVPPPIGIGIDVVTAVLINESPETVRDVQAFYKSLRQAIEAVPSTSEE